MPQLLSTSRAARLANVSRGDLQRRIRNGDLSTFEGKIDATDLIKVYPEINLSEDSMLEKVRDIKSKARPKKRYEEDIPSAEVLVTRLKNISQDLFHARTDLNRLEQLINEIKGRMNDICAKPDCDPKQEIEGLSQWLDQAFADFTNNAADSAHLEMRDAFMRIMAAHVKLLPSGHDFFLEGKDSLLGAAIRAGLYVNYGCSKGNCGACKARLVKGEVHKIRDHDYILSEHENNMGYLLMCSNTAVTDVTLEASEAQRVTDIPWQKIRAGIRKTEPLEEGLILLHIQTPKTSTLRFMAGQHIRMSLDSGAQTVLPIASCPCDSRNLQIPVRHKPDDPFSEEVFAGLDLPEAVNIEGPDGDFVLVRDTSRPLLFIAWDDGFGMIRSLTEHAISIDNAESIHLIRITDGDKLPFMDGLCRAWTDALDNVSYHHFAKNDLSQLEATIRSFRTDPTRFLVYIAGVPSERRDEMSSLAGKLGIPGEDVAIRGEV
jgi:CDP-4-dehydro-6-deoxyglucose reductase